MDINDTSQLERLRVAARNPSGKLIVDFLKEQLKDVSFDKINANDLNEKVGQDFKKVQGIREFIQKVLDLLTP
jgi:hypothetical protein